MLFIKDSSGNLILALANIAVLREDNSSQYQLSCQTGARSARHSLRPQSKCVIAFVFSTQYCCTYYNSFILQAFKLQPRLILRPSW